MNLNDLKALKALTGAFLAAETRVAAIMKSVAVLLVKCVREVDVLLVKCVRANDMR